MLKIFTKEDATETSLCGATIKDLSKITCVPENIVLVDDKPKNARNGTTIGISQYYQELTDNHFNDVMAFVTKSGMGKVSKSLKLDRIKYPPKGEQNQLSDTELNIVIQLLQQHFNIN